MFDMWAASAGSWHRWTRRCAALPAKGHRLHVVYEAGPCCGFVIWPHLNALGQACDVVARSSIPKRSGDCIKTDRRDAMMLARLDRTRDSRRDRQHAPRRGNWHQTGTS